MPAKALTLGRPVYRGYMPIDLPQHRPKNKFKPWYPILGKPRHDIYPPQVQEEWAQEANYPPINDGTKKGLVKHIRLDWYETIKNLPTVDQKLYEINRHIDHYIAHLKNWTSVNNALPMVQYLTHTHFIQDLPSSYKSSKALESQLQSLQLDKTKSNDINQEHVSRIKHVLLDQIALEKYESRKLRNQFISYSIRESNREQYVQDSLVQNLVSCIRRALAPDVNQELLDYQLDASPAIRSWWYHSGFQPPNKKLYYNSRKDDQGRINQMIQCDGHSAINFRSDSFIEPILDFNDDLVTDKSLIKEPDCSLNYYRAHYKFKRPVALPGFWIEDKPKYDCPHSCFLTTDSLDLRNKLYQNLAVPLHDTEIALNSQAILTAYSWLNSLSMYHGYTPYHEIDYPFTCQVITTDGQHWLFNIFQMNSHTFHRDLGGPKRNNVCWSSGLMKLYEEYKGEGQFIGVNDQVLELILSFFSKQTSPSYTASLNLRPHLGQDERSEEERNETRESLRKTIEQLKDNHLKWSWSVPMFEHIFFRSPEFRNQIRHMKAPYHKPKPKTPRIFE